MKDRNGKVDPITLTFTQEERKIIRNLQDDEFQIPERGGLLEVTIEYNTEYTVEIDPDAQSWARFVETKALSYDYLQFVFEANEGEQRIGHATVKDKAGKAEPVTLTFVQEAQSREWKARRMMERVYEAWGAREWKNYPWVPGENWPGFYFDYEKQTMGFQSYDFGINREIPECIGELGDLLGEMHIMEEPGLTGTLPDSFRKLTGLRRISIQSTGMTSIPDVFGDMKQLTDIHH